MNNPILRSAVIVFVFWWVVLSLRSLDSLQSLSVVTLSLTIQKLTILALCTIVGAFLPLIYLVYARQVRLDQLTGTSRRGIEISIGPVPKGLGAPDRILNSKLDPDEGHPLEVWISRLKAERPDIYAVFQALVDIYAAHLHIPAAPVSYGHGGRNLFEHTMVVVDKIMERAQTYSFDGGYGKSGQKTHPLLDPQYVFDRHDLLIPLLGFAHDVGKISAYRVGEDGKVTEVLPDHDRPGRLLLAQLEEVWSLPVEDRTALLDAVGHYHHPQDLPRHANDRSRALMELLLEADVAAGEWEGKNPLHRASPLTPGVIPKEEPQGLSIVSVSTESPSPLESHATRAVQNVHDQDNEADTPEDLDDYENALIAHLREVMASPVAINGSRKEFRIGYKYGDLIYLKEALLCKAVANAMGEPKLASPSARKGDNRSQLTEDVMRALSKLGLLFEELDGRRYSYKSALFTVEWYDSRAFLNPPPKPIAQLKLETDPAMVIVQAKGVFAHLSKLPDCRLVPRITKALMGAHKALKKPAGKSPMTQEEESDAGPKDPEFRMDSDAAMPPETLESNGEIDPPIAFSRDVESLPTGGLEFSSERTKSGLRAPSTGTSSESESEGDELLDGILALCSAAEARTAARAAAKSREQCERGTTGESRPAPAPEGVATGGLADNSVVQIKAAVTKLQIIPEERANSSGVVFQTCLISDELRAELGDHLDVVRASPSDFIKIVADKRSKLEYLAFRETDAGAPEKT